MPTDFKEKLARTKQDLEGNLFQIIPKENIYTCGLELGMCAPGVFKLLVFLFAVCLFPFSLKFLVLAVNLSGKSNT